ncbi:hypothetical protein GOBAR_DD01210 [Gossypium barbadense]|nr:hypothetical protein GOBAR_DD01210 [Gossypium barbadense]
MAMKLDSYLQLFFLGCFYFSWFLSSPAEAAVRKYQFDIRVKNVSRLCHAKPIVTVNGRHGLKQFRNGWAEGPAYITQCPIKTGHSYTYDFNVTGQRGTLWWHAHILWLRATVYGAIVIMPKEGRMFPFPQPHGETKIILGEWWNSDVETLVNQANKLGLPPPTSDSHTINGKPGPLFPCSSKPKVPLKVDRHLFYTVGLGANPCSSCQNGTQLTASLNNITFVMPKVGLLQAHYFHIKGVFKTDFPDRPPVPFNYTGVPLTANLGTSLGTRLSKVAFNSTIELVLQDTNLLTVESHPFHLHGFNFFVVGSGVGNFDPSKDPAKFNLVDPPERNTVGVPTGGWTAIRFRADNPGVWFMHCHLELHTMWGLKMAFVVENGKSPEESIIPPPKDLPPC